MDAHGHLSGLNAAMRLSGEKPIDDWWPAHVLGVAKVRRVWFFRILFKACRSMEEGTAQL